MSEAVFARFPRFDEPAASQNGDTHLVGGVPEEQESLAQQEAKQQAVREQRMEAALQSLANEAERAQVRLQDQTTEWVVAISERLFPELSRLFLAEEIGKQLPALIPGAATQVEIRADAELAGQLREVIARSNRLTSLCSVADDANVAEGKAEVSWVTGGLNLDFSGLLDACVDRLRSVHSTMRKAS